MPTFVSTANVTDVTVVALNATTVQVSWTAVQIPSDGELVGYHVYYRAVSSTTKRQPNGNSRFFPAGVTQGVIGSLVYSQAYQFSVAAEVRVLGLSYMGNVSLSGSNSPIINPGNSICQQ